MEKLANENAHVGPDALVRAGESCSPQMLRTAQQDGCGHPPLREQAKIQLPTKRRGEIAEAAFLHKAASLGFSVSKPWGESDRYDFILETGGRCWRVQVKSAHTSAINGYAFHACGNVYSRRYTVKDIDFIVGYVVPDNAWYVIPIEVFKDITSVKVFPSSKRRMSRYEKYREAWDYLRETAPPTQNIEEK